MTLHPRSRPHTELGDASQGPLLTGLNALSAVVTSERADTAELFTGQEADRYIALARLGEGGMGQVSLALDSKLRRQVALKVPRGPGSRARLAREAFITAQLEHPGIVTVYDAGTNAGGEPFYTMRLVRGRSLEERLIAADDNRPPLRALLAACEAVGFAHDAGVVHRDLKPANIMVGDFGETIVVDWGLALTREELEAHRGEVAGTPGYMCPEQLRGEVPDPRADVWSLGAILYRVLSGRPPGSSTTRPESAHALGPIEPLAALAPTAPRELIAIAERALAPDPDARYPHALALARDLENWLLGRRVSAYEYSPFELLKRLVSAWRVPLAVAAVALVALTILGVIAADEVVAERDRAVLAERDLGRALASADTNLGRALLGLAERHRDAFEPAEAEVAAAAALSHLTSANPSAGPTSLVLEARGILAHLDVPRPRLIARSPLPACARIAIGPLGEKALCLETGVLYRLEPEPVVLMHYPTPILDAALTATHLYASHRLQELSTYALNSAAPLVPDTHTDSHPRLVTESGATPNLWRLWGFRAAHHAASGGEIFDACADTGAAVEASVLVPETDPQAPAHERQERQVLSLCNDGVLRHLADHGRTVLAELSLGTHGRAVALNNDDLYVATEPGRLLRVGYKDSLSLGWSIETRVTGVRSLHLSPDSRLLAIGAEGRGVTIVDAEDGHVLFRLPQSAGAEPRFTASGELLAFSGVAVSRFELPATPIAARLGQPGAAGLATFAIGDNGRHLITGDGEGWVRVMDEAGRTRAARRFGDRVVKRLDALGDRIWVSHFNDEGLLELDLELRRIRHLGGLGTRLRRIAALASGELLAADYTRTWGRLGEGTYEPVGDFVAMDLAASPNRDLAVLVGVEGQVATYRSGTTRELGTFAGARAAAVDGLGVVLVSADAVRWLSPDGAELAKITSPIEVLDVAVGDGVVALGRADGRTLLYPREPGQAPLMTLGGHAKRVAQVEVSAGLVYSASWDGSVMRYRLGPIEPSQRLAAAGRQWGLSIETLLE